jgi:hypothetical protein
MDGKAARQRKANAGSIANQSRNAGTKIGTNHPLICNSLPAIHPNLPEGNGPQGRGYSRFYLADPISYILSDLQVNTPVFLVS